MKYSKCKECGEKVANPVRVSLRTFCSNDCAYKNLKHKMSKQPEKKEKKTKTKRDTKKMIAQCLVNSFVRHRDKDKPCVSCGAYFGSIFHAGHYIDIGSNEALRYNPDNIHKQCAICNVVKKHDKSVKKAFRAELIERIGEKRVEALESTNKYIYEHNYDEIIEKFNRKNWEKIS